MKEASKSVKRALHELAAVAYEEELRRALVPLAEAFEAWRSCKLSSGDLAERIHAFNKGTARELFVRYDRRLINHAVARAIVAGIIKRGSVPSEVLDHLAGALEFCESREAES